MKRIINRATAAQKIILAVIAVCYLAFILADSFSGSLNSGAIKYFCMLLCYALLLSSSGQAFSKSDYLRLLLAFTLTLIADALLIFTANYLYGVFVFCGVQLTYVRRYSYYSVINKRFHHGCSTAVPRRHAARLIPLANETPMAFYCGSVSINAFRLALILSIAAALFSYLAFRLEPLYCACVSYAVLFSAVIASIIPSRLPVINKRLALYGALLFLLCDINVALYNLLPRDWSLLPGLLIWVFYLPSQVMLSLSAIDYM